MEVLIVMDRKNGQHLAAEAVIRNYHSADTITTKDLNSVTTGDVSTWIGTLSADTYGKMYILVVVQSSGATGVLSFNQYASMIPLLDTDYLPDALSSGTCQANATATEIVLASAEDEANDYYNGDYIVTAGTTVVQRYISDYVGASDTATVATTTTAITTTETYTIYAAEDLDEVMVIAAETYESQEIFSLLYPNMKHTPRFIEELGAMPASGSATATADSVATTSGVSTLTDSSAFTADALVGWFVAIRSATTGAGQVLEIESNTDSVLTLKDAWKPVPTGSIVYEVVDRKHVAIARYFLQFALRYLTPDPSDNDQLRQIMKMISNNETIAQTDEFTFQDLDLLEEFKATGQVIMRAIGMGITS